MSAISLRHKLKNLTDNTSSSLVSKTLLGIANKQNSAPRTLLPITRNTLHKLIDSLQYVTAHKYDYYLYKALFLLTHYACLRVGEAVQSHDPTHTLNIKQFSVVTHAKRSAYKISFLSYKHSHGRTPTHLLTPSPKNQYCPVAALTKYISSRAQNPGPLFQDLNGKPLTRQQFCNILKKTLEQAQLPSHKYNTHSFRIGRATQLAMEGVSKTTIKSTGRWQSSAYLKYIKPSYFTLPQ